MTIVAGQTEPAVTKVRCAHGPWSDLALHTIGWRSFQDLCSQVCEVVLGRPVEIFREAQDGGQDAVFLIPSPSNEQFIGTVQCKHTSDAGKALKVGDPAEEDVLVGPIINDSQVESLRKKIASAEEAAAEVLALCVDCPVRAGCFEWARADSYTGLAAGLAWAGGVPHLPASTRYQPRPLAG